MIDTFINSKTGPYTFRLNGQNYHRIGSLLPISRNKPRFAQLYIYGTKNDINNRLSASNHDHDRSNIDRIIVEGLVNMLDVNNEIVKAFRMARDRLQLFDVNNEIAGLLVGDLG